MPEVGSVFTGPFCTLRCGLPGVVGGRAGFGSGGLEVRFHSSMVLASLARTARTPSISDRTAARSLTEFLPWM
jgi:hypothetical protein